jgi:hypothetical protein
VRAKKPLCVGNVSYAITWYPLENEKAKKRGAGLLTVGPCKTGMRYQMERAVGKAEITVAQG